MRCKRCKKWKFKFLLNKDYICKECEEEIERENIKKRKKQEISEKFLKLKESNSLISTPNYYNNYYVYGIKIIETNKIVYIGYGSGDTSKKKLETHPEIITLREIYNFEVVYFYTNLTENEAIIIRDNEIENYLNQTDTFLFNRIAPNNNDAYSRSDKMPKYKFETAGVFYSVTVDEKLLGLKYKKFDSVTWDILKKPYFKYVNFNYEEVNIVYGGDINKYLDEVHQYLEYLNIKPIATKYAKSVTCWIYFAEDELYKYNQYQKTAKQKIGRTIPCVHLIDVLKFLRKEIGDIEFYDYKDICTNAKYNRVPITDIKNKDNPELGYKKGNPYFVKSLKYDYYNDFDKKLELLDKARFNGYLEDTYSEYIKLFKKNGLYDDAISIIIEALSMIEGNSLADMKQEMSFKDELRKILKNI